MKLTREQIMAMEPGPRFNEMVAIKIMGYEQSRMQDGFVRMGAMATYPKPYSTNISAAWEVVEKNDINGFLVNYLDRGNAWGEGWHCVMNQTHHVHKCKTAPEAICKAALLAILEQEG